MVFGTNALFTKPAQSLAPMMAVSILNQYGYADMHEVSKAVDPRYDIPIQSTRDCPGVFISAHKVTWVA